MTASFDDPPLDSTTLEALDESYQEVAVRLQLETQRINRLLETAFYNPLRAHVGLKACLRGVGVTGTIDVLEGKSLLPRSHYFGIMRGNLLSRGDRVRAKLALAELPEAIQERELLGHKLDDLVNTRRVLLEKVATRHRHVPDPGRGGNESGRRRTR